jgi:hypothetical protein
MHDGGTPRIQAMPTTRAATTPPVTTFTDTTLAAPTLARFQGKTFIAWSGTGVGSLNVAIVVKSGSGYKLTSKVTLGVDLSPGRSPALAVFNGRLYLAWSDLHGNLNVISSPDGVHFGNKITLGDTSPAGPALAAVNRRLYLAWTGTDGHLNFESTTNGMTFGNKLILNQTSYIVTGTQITFLAPALASYSGKLWIAWTGSDVNHYLNIVPYDGAHFGAHFVVFETSGAAPALTVENSAVAGQPARLVLGWSGTGNLKINYATTTDGQHFSGLVTFNQLAYGGLALDSPSAGTLDFAWAGYETPVRHLNFMEA